MTTKIRQAGVEAWELVRELRLRALADAPFAFASRLEDERDQPSQMWRDRLSRSDAATFIAVDETGTVGLVTVFLVPEQPSRAHLVSMWVSPERRRTGLGRELVERVTSWAVARDAETIELWVTDTNEPARELYRRMGFDHTGERQPLPSDPTLVESRMIRPVRLGRT